jgi:hypothetical protein
VTWGRAEMAPEVVGWLLELSDDDFGFVAYHIDLLQELGPHLGDPYVRRLPGALRVLRLHLGGRVYGLTHVMPASGRIALLTVLREDGPAEEADVQRALDTIQHCVTAGSLRAEEVRDLATA